MAKKDGKLGAGGDEVPGSGPALRAYHELLDLKRDSGAIVGTDAMVFALSWLAVGRLLVKGEVAGFSHYDDLLKRDFWMAAVRAGIPEESLPLVWGNPVDQHEGNPIHHRAFSITRNLLIDDPDGDWVLFDRIWDLANSRLVGKDLSNYAYDANLCDLLFNLLGEADGGTVWLPFDLSGQLVVRAVRRGLTPLAFGPGWNRPNPVARLLLILEPRRPNTRLPEFGVALDSYQRPIVKADFLIACPPLGAKVLSGAGWKKWEAEPAVEVNLDPLYRKQVGRHFAQLDRTDSWAIAAFWPVVTRRAVFMTLPNVLFGKGQEQRLRESLIIGGRNVASVITLPGRLVQGTGVVTALTMMDRAYHGRSVRMVDAAECTVETKSTMRFSRMLDASRITELVFGTKTEEGLSTDASYDLIAEQDFNLVPSRYLNQVDASDQVGRVPLGQLVEAVRGPVASKDDDAVVVAEVGIPELDRWQVIGGPFAKTTSVQPHKLRDCAVRNGDILVSIKGTIGKTGLIGEEPARSGLSAVCSQSCVILRVSSEKITPLQLFLYLRSDDFRRQAEALKVGASVAHVTPATLLQDVKVPISALLDQSSAHAQYAELCGLELQVDDARERLKEIQAAL